MREQAPDDDVDLDLDLDLDADPDSDFDPEFDLVPGSVLVTVTESGRRATPRVLPGLTAAFAAVAGAAAVLVTVALLGPDPTPAPRTPVGELDAGTVAAPALAPAAVPGTTRLAMLGSRVLLDTRAGIPVPAGGMEPVALPQLPAGTTAVLLEVSLLSATGPGAVTVGPAGAAGPVLSVSRSGSQASATTVVPLGADPNLEVATAGGGHLVVRLTGAFEPAATSTSGRVVAVPATPALHLVPAKDGKNATVDLTAVEPLRSAGPVSAVLLQISADVGPNGGFVAVGRSADTLDHEVFWAAGSGNDRTRTGFVVLPVQEMSFTLHYRAGSLLDVDVAGYVTGAGAGTSTVGLVVPVPAGTPAAAPLQASDGTGTDAFVVPYEGLAGVPVDRVGAVLMNVTATGDAVGAVSVYPADAGAPARPVAHAYAGGPRAATTLVRTPGGKVRVAAKAGTTVTMRPMALILTG